MLSRNACETSRVYDAITGQVLRAELRSQLEKATVRTEMEKNKMKAAMGLKDLKAELEKAALLQQIRELQRDLAQIRSQRPPPSRSDIDHNQRERYQQMESTPKQTAAPPPLRSAGATAAIDLRAQTAARAMPAGLARLLCDPQGAACGT